MVKRTMAVTVFALLTLVAFAPIASAGGGCHSNQFTDASGVRVDIRDICFTPTVIRIQPGQAVTWTNFDDTAHTVTGAGQRWGAFDELSLNDTVTYRFASSGVFPYFCVIHPGMVGSVVVGDGTSADTQIQPAVPVRTVATTPPAPAPQPVVTASGVSAIWRVLALVGFGLLALTLLALGARRLGLRRGVVRV